MPKRGTSRVSNMFSTLKAMLQVLFNLIAKVFTQETVKAPTKKAEPPVRLVVLSPDGNAGNDFPQDSPPFKLCHGAEHRLEVKAPEGSTWVEQRLSLHFVRAEEIPSRYGLSAIPQFVTDTFDEEEAYQVLAATGVKWQLAAAIAENVRSGDVALGLGSYWQAPKYPIDAHVGDHWYSITDLVWDGRVPIIDKGIPATLTATVCSAFDVKRPVKGATVKWMAGTREFGAGETDANGQLSVQYMPEERDIEGGEVTITATCTDAFGHTLIQSRKLRAFVKAPWDELMTMTLKEKDGPAVKPTALSMRLKRGVEYQLTLAPSGEGNYFIGHTIALDWFEGSLWRDSRQPGKKQLGIDFEPKDGREMTKAGLAWDIVAGEESGLFTLQAWSEELSKDVPFPLDGVQMSANLADEADLMPAAQDEDGVPPIFQRGVGKPVRIVPKVGSPLGRMELGATLKFVRLANDIPATQIPAEPPYNTANPVTDTGALWTLVGSAGGDSGQFSLQVDMPGFTTPLTLEKGLMMSSVLSDEAQVLIDGKPLGDASLLLWRNTLQVITLQPRANIKSPLGKTTLKGELLFKKGSLEVDKVEALPDYEDKLPILDDGLSWDLTGTNVSGTFGLQIKVKGFEASLEIPALLLSANIRDEADITVDGKAPDSTMIFFRRNEYAVKIEPKTGSPLRVRDFFKSSLMFTDGSLTADKVKANPNYAQDYPLPAEGLTWKLKGENVSGSFALKVKVTEFNDSVDIPVVLLSADIRDEVDVTVGERNMTETDASPSKRAIQSIFWIGDAWVTEEGKPWDERMIFRRDTEYIVGFLPKPGSPLGLLTSDVRMTFTEGTLSPDNVEATPTYNEPASMTPEGLTWKLKCKSVSGRFTLGLSMEGFSSGITLSNAMLLSRNPSDEVRTVVGEDNKVIFRRGVSGVAGVVARSGSPLENDTIFSLLDFVKVSQIDRDGVDVDPDYGVEQGAIPGLTYWGVVGKSQVSGIFGMEFHLRDFSSSLQLDNAAVISSHLSDEVTHFPFFLNAQDGSDSYTIYLHAYSPLPVFNLHVKSTVHRLDPGVKIRCEPPFGDSRPIQDRLMWTVYNDGGKSGNFSVAIEVDEFSDKIIIDGAV